MANSAQARDPVCGMYVDTATAKFQSTFEGGTYYFCAAGCKRTFDANPAHYAERAAPPRGASREADTARASEPLERHDPPFTKADGIVAPKFGAAGSGGAEYEPLPEAHRGKGDEGRGKK